MEFLQDILDLFRQVGPITDELVAAAGVKTVYISRHGEDLPALFRGEAGGDERAAPLRRLHHHRPQ